ncbi:sugar MFS transporter [Bdellovibrionota bacterium FG-1]
MASTSTISINTSAAGKGQSYPTALTLMTSLFFMWGFLTCLNDILIPHLKALFDLNYTQAMLIQFCFFTAYFIVSVPAGMLVEKIGYRLGIVVGLATAGIGCLTFYPAAAIQSYAIFLLAFFILAAGITILQVAANPYVAILGRAETAASRLNFSQALNSLGTTIAPLFGSFIILANPGGSVAERAAAVQTPYVGLALALLVLAGIFLGFKGLPAVEAASPSIAGAETDTDDRDSAWKYRHLVLGAVGIFVYVGAEVSIGSFLVSYISQPFIGGLSIEQAGKFVAYYWGGAMVGRFIGSAVQQKVKPQTVLVFNALIAALLVFTTMSLSGNIAMYAILLVGLFNSIMFPTIFTLAIDGLGKHTGQGSGILCAAIVGGAIIPMIQGATADLIGIHHAFILPVFCYLYIAYYGWKGYAMVPAPVPVTVLR